VCLRVFSLIVFFVCDVARKNVWGNTYPHFELGLGLGPDPTHRPKPKTRSRFRALFCAIWYRNKKKKFLGLKNFETS